MCESTLYIIRRVDATIFWSPFLIISTLVVGESWRLPCPPPFGGEYTDDIWIESWEYLWLTRDVDHCWVGIINRTNPCWVSWRFLRFIITILRNIKYPYFEMYNPWSIKKFWFSEITTGSSSKRGSSLKVWYIKNRRLSGSDWKRLRTRQLFVKIKFAPDTDIGRHEWQWGGRGGGCNEIINACWASHLYTREICGCVEKAGVGGHSTKGIFTCTKLLAINCDPTHYWRSPY
jgi:hypothetical protein